MTKKHFVWGANHIITVCALDGCSEYWKHPVYKGFVEMFTEYGKNFDKNKFDNYIQKRLI